MMFLLLCCSVNAIRLIEYRLWKYYGQVIPDTSLNSNHGVNGLNYIEDDSDCFYSDRGLYFSHQTSALRLPPNDQVQNIHRISNPYIAIMWVNNFNTEGRYFSRWMNQQYLVVSSSGPNTIGISYKTISGLYSTYDNISGHAGI